MGDTLSVLLHCCGDKGTADGTQNPPWHDANRPISANPPGESIVIAHHNNEHQQNQSLSPMTLPPRHSESNKPGSSIAQFTQDPSIELQLSQHAEISQRPNFSEPKSDSTPRKFAEDAFCFYPADFFPLFRINLPPGHSEGNNSTSSIAQFMQEQSIERQPCQHTKISQRPNLSEPKLHQQQTINSSNVPVEPQHNIKQQQKKILSCTRSTLQWPNLSQQKSGCTPTECAEEDSFDFYPTDIFSLFRSTLLPGHSDINKPSPTSGIAQEQSIGKQPFQGAETSQQQNLSEENLDETPMRRTSQSSGEIFWCTQSTSQCGNLSLEKSGSTTMECSKITQPAKEDALDFYPADFIPQFCITFPPGHSESNKPGSSIAQFMQEKSIGWQPSQHAEISQRPNLSEPKSDSTPRKFAEDAFYFYPTDLFPSFKSIESNIIKGPYESVDHYIQTHLYLLKEDFESRLRAGIAYYLKKPRARNRDVWIYKDATVGVTSGNEHLFKIMLTSRNFNKIDWEKSNRFLHGSMVLVARDNFKVFHVAIIKDRGNVESEEPPFGNKYYINVEFRTSPPIDSPFQRYLLIEPRSFFEPYHQAMKALTRFYKTGLPLERYLVNVETSPRLPAYVTHTIDQSIVRLSQDTDWPSAESMALNANRRKAIMSALTNQMMLIQGPPGTGKTYTAYKMIKYLLDNNKFSSPILVVCFYNHSLDQLLEGLLDRGVRVLRMGGQSKSETLKEFNLSKVRADSSALSVLKQLKVVESLIQENASKLHHYWNSIKLLKMKLGIVHLGLLKEFEIVSQNVFTTFGNEKAFYEWLVVRDTHVNGFLSFPTSEQLSVLEILRSELDCTPTLVYSHSLGEIMQNIVALKVRLLPFQQKHLRKYELVERRKIAKILNSKLVSFNVLRTHLDKYETTDASMVQSVLATQSLLYLPLEHRWRIYRVWEATLLTRIENDFQTALNQRISLKETHRLLKNLFKCRKINSARPQVLGITTSGAAAHHRVLEEIAPPIVIVEEAAEILESHIVASLTKSCQHLILIGDHQQLKPSTASHYLAQSCHLDVSLFERMYNNGALCQALNVQNRMRPEISALICPSVYRNLVNHPSVFNYPDVPGVAKNVLFFHHTQPEEAAADSESRYNQFEANFSLALCSYLLKQETYAENPSRITILTAYKEQERNISTGNAHDLMGVDTPPEVVITSVDNYQGKENDVIILSLVRSNPEGNVGFLATKNRICVALSRAKHGLFILGNMDCLVKKQFKIWREIRNVLQSQDAIVNDFPLKCKIHGNVTRVKQVTDILKLKHGGCPEMCQILLECGHVCQYECHGYDLAHKENFKCQAACVKKCPMGHSCPDICGAECPPCLVIVRDPFQSCFVTDELTCYEFLTNDR